MPNLTIGGVQAVFSADSSKFDASTAGVDQQLGILGKTAELAAGKVKTAGNVIDQSATQQERAKERMRRAWAREMVQQDRTIEKEKEVARARELASLKARIEAESVEQLARAKEREEAAARFREGAIRIGEFAGLAFGAGAVIDGFKEMVFGTMEAGVELGHLHQQTGISVQDLSVLKYAAATTGVEFETLQKGFKKLATEAYGASQGSKQALKAFSDLGVSQAELKARGNDLFAVLTLVADKFQSMPDGIQKNALATELFGKAGQQLIPILDQGAAAIENLKSEAPIFSDEDIERMEKMHKSIARMKGAWAEMALEITSSLAPAITGLMEGFTALNRMFAASPGRALQAMAGTALNQFVPGAGDAMYWNAIGKLSDKGLRAPADLPEVGGKNAPGGDNAPPAAAAAAADRTMTLNLGELFNKDIEEQTKNRDANLQFYKDLDAAEAKAFSEMASASESQQAWLAKFWISALAPKQDVTLAQPEPRRFQALSDAIEGTIAAFTDLPMQLAHLFEQGVSSLNNEIARAVSGQRTNFAGVFRGLSESATKSALQQVEGGLLKEFGLGRSSGKPDGSASSPFYTVQAGGRGAGSMPSLTGAIASPGAAGGGLMQTASKGLMGMLNDSNWFSSLFGGRLFGAGSIFGSLQGRASGGPVMAGVPYMVGERGPEPFIPSTSGTIIPNHMLGGGTTYNIDARGTDPALTAAHTAHAIRVATSQGAAAGAHAVTERARRTPR